MKEKPESPEWLLKSAKEIIRGIGYDPDGDVHSQFLEKWKLQPRIKKNPPGRPKKIDPKK